MKTLLLFISFISNFSLLAQTTFNIRFKNDNSQEMKNMAIMSDESIIVASYKPDTINYAALLLAKVNIDGSYQWSKTISLKEYILGTPEIIPDGETGFITASIIVDASSKRSILIFRCDNSGKIIWQKVIDLLFEKVAPYELKLGTSKSNNFYLTLQNRKEDFMLYKFSLQGDIKWFRNFKQFNYYSWGKRLLAITETSENKIAIAISDISCEFYCSHLHLFVFNEDGNPYTHLQLLRNIYDYRFRPVEIMAADKKGNIDIFIRGDFANQATELIHMNVNVKTNRANTERISPLSILSLQYYLRTKNLNNLQMKVFMPEYDLYSDSFYCFTKNWDLIKGYTIHPTRIANMYVTKYDSLGRTCPVYTAPVFDKEVYKETKLLFLRYTFENIPIPKMIIYAANLKTEEQSDYKEVCYGVPDKELNKEKTTTPIHLFNNARIIPNPVHNSCILEIKTENTETATIEIFSLSGSKLLDEKINLVQGVNHIKMDVHALVPGSYFVSYTSRNVKQVLKFMKI